MGGAEEGARSAAAITASPPLRASREAGNSGSVGSFPASAGSLPPHPPCIIDHSAWAILQSRQRTLVASDSEVRSPIDSFAMNAPTLPPLMRCSLWEQE